MEFSEERVLEYCGLLGDKYKFEVRSKYLEQWIKESLWFKIKFRLFVKLGWKKFLAKLVPEVQRRSIYYEYCL